MRVLALLTFLLLAAKLGAIDYCEVPSLRLVHDPARRLSACNPYDTIQNIVTGGSIHISSKIYTVQGEIELEPLDPPTDTPHERRIKLKSGARSGTASVTVTLNYSFNNCNDPEPEVKQTVVYTIVGEEDGGCSACSKDRRAGSGYFDNASVHAAFYLGMLDDQTDAGFLSLDADAPSPDLTKAQSLKYNFNYPGVTRYPTSGTLQQVKSPQVLARIVDTSTTDYSFTIEYFHSGDFNAAGNGPWNPNPGASPFVVWTVRNPGSNTKVVEITSTAGQTGTFTYDDSSTPYKWSLTETGNLRTTVAWEETVGTDMVDKIHEVRSGTTLLERTKRRYQIIGDSRYLKEVVEGSGTPTRTTTYTLITTGPATGRPSRIDYPDGRWEVMEYDGQARVTARYEGYKDLPPPAPGVPPTAGNGRKTEFYHGALDSVDAYFRTERPRITTEYVPSYSGSAWTWVPVSQRLYWTPDADTAKEAISPRPGSGAWYDGDNLVTTTVSYGGSPSSPSYMRPKLVVRPDGTGSAFTYTVGSSGNLTKVERRGPVTLDTAYEPVIESGTLTTTVQSGLGKILSITVQDLIATGGGASLSQQTYSYFGSGLQDDYTITDLAGRVTTYLHSSCCGLVQSVTDPDGKLTEYEYDDLKRRVATKTTWGSAWVKMTNILDGVGRTLAVQRIPSSGATVTLDRYAYDVLGRVTHHTNAWGGVTTTTYDASFRTNTTTFPDLGTRIETTYRDGRIKQVSGTAVAPIGYDYGVQPEGSPAVMREVVRTIRLTTAGATQGWGQAGATNEWTLDVSDDLGRNLRTYYAKASGSSYSENTYNTLGQVVSRRDAAEGVQRLRRGNGVRKAAPDGHGFRLRAEGGLGFEGGAAQRKPMAAPVDRVGNGGVEQAEVERDSF